MQLCILYRRNHKFRHHIQQFIYYQEVDHRFEIHKFIKQKISYETSYLRAGYEFMTK